MKSSRFNFVPPVNWETEQRFLLLTVKTVFAAFYFYSILFLF